MSIIPWADAPPLVQTVYHEAGHSVLAYAVRLPIREIRVGAEPREPVSMDEFTGGATHRSGVTEFVGESVPLSQDPAKLRPQAISRSLLLVAGPLAVGVLLDDHKTWHGDREIVGASGLLDRAFGEEAGLHFWGVIRSALAILESLPGRFALERLASKLFGDRTVSGDDAERIMADAWEEGEAGLQEAADDETLVRAYWPYDNPEEHGFKVGAASEIQRLDAALEAARAYACGRTNNTRG